MAEELNRRQRRQIAELEQQAADLKVQGNRDLTLSKQARANGSTEYADDLKGQAYEARDEWERVKDEIDSRKANPKTHWWNS